MKVVSSVIFSLLLATIASAQERSVVIPPMLQYAAKFVCGAPKPGTANVNVAASGKYFTAINVHNPSEWETASFFKKFAVGLPQEGVGKISQFLDVRLMPDEVMQIDCGNIWKHLGNSGTFVEGFVVIETRYELDVVSVYTAANAPAYEVSSIETERVPYRVMKRCPAQPIDISTGGSVVWNIIGIDPSGGTTPRAASVMSPVHTWGPTSGMTFVSYSMAGSSLNPFKQADWTYETRFCVCPLQRLQSSQPQLSITLINADNKAEVYLNGISIGSFTGSSSGVPVATINALNTSAGTLFQPGPNSLSVKVTDTSASKTGFGLIGTVSGTMACQ